MEVWGRPLAPALALKHFKNEAEAFEKIKPLQLIEPTFAAEYNEEYLAWKKVLEQQLAD